MAVETAIYEGAKLQYYYFDYANFKQKEAAMLIHCIGGQRLRADMRFEGYANMEFAEDDKRREFPKFTVYDEYSRKLTNCLTFDISESDRNVMKRFNKLFLYQYYGKSHSYYGFVMLNTETGHSSNHFVIDHEETDLFVHLNTMFNGMMNEPKLIALRKKSEALDNMVEDRKRRYRSA